MSDRYNHQYCSAEAVRSRTDGTTLNALLVIIERIGESMAAVLGLLGGLGGRTWSRTKFSSKGMTSTGRG